MKRLLMILPHCSTGGMPAYALKKIELLKTDYKIWVIDYSNSGGEVFNVQKKLIRNIVDRLIVLSENRFELLDYIEEFNPDIIHMEEMPEYFMDDEIAKKIYLNPNRTYTIIETTHDSSFDVNNKKFFPDSFAFVSLYSIDQFKSLNIPMKLVEFPVDKKVRPNREQILNELNLDPNKTHILNVGLFTPRKNQAEVFQYAEELINEPIVFHCVGNQASNFEHYWKPLMEKKTDNVVIWGERDDVDKFYSCMDLLLFTSRGHDTDKETNPLVIKEALSWGMPVLLYNLPVYLDMYNDNSNIQYLKEENYRADIKTTEVLNYNINLIKSYVKKKDRVNELLDEYRMYFIHEDFEVDEFKTVNRLFGLNQLITENLSSDSVVCEIGSHSGVSSELFALKCKDLYCIDIWLPYPEINSMELQIKAEDIFDKRMSVYNNVHKIKNDSSIEYNSFPDEFFDCVYIDGNHDDDHIKSDILNWLPKIKSDGYLSGHDYYSVSIKTCLSQLFPNIHIKTYEDSSWIISKSDINNYKRNKMYNVNYQLALKQCKDITDIAQVPWEFESLCELLNKKEKRQYALEIGVERGGTSFIFSHYFEKMYSLDLKSHPDWEKVKQVKSNIEFMVGNSHTDETVQKIRDLNIKFDFIFIDGDHSESGAMLDLVLYSEFLAEGGYIGFHDIKENKPWHMEQGCYVDYMWNTVKKHCKHVEFCDNGFGWAGIGVIFPEPTMDFSKLYHDHLFIISTHPTDRIKDFLTIECVKRLKFLGCKVLLTSHVEISEELKSLCDYYIYDENNPIHTGFFKAYSSNDKREMELYNYETYGMGVLVNYINGAKKAQELGYENVFFLNYDWILHYFDYKQIDEIYRKVRDEKLLGFISKDTFDTTNPNDDTIHTVMIYLNTEYFLKKFSNITYEQFTVLSNNTNFLEKLYHTVLYPEIVNNKFYSIYGIQNVMPHTSINLCSSWPDIILLPVNEGNNYEFTPYIANYTRLPEMAKDVHNPINIITSIDVYNNNKRLCKLSEHDEFIFKVTENDNYVISFKILVNNEEIYYSKKELSLNNYNSILRNGKYITRQPYTYAHDKHITEHQFTITYNSPDKKLFITNHDLPQKCNIYIRTLDNQEFVDKIENQELYTNINYWFQIGKTLKYEHKYPLDIIVDVYDEQYNYLFSKKCIQNIETSKTINNYKRKDTRMFVSFCDEKMAPVAEYLVKSLNQFSDYTILLYGINFDIPFNYPNMIKKRIDYNINHVIFLKPYVILQSFLDGVQEGIFIDADNIVNKNIDDLWSYQQYIDKYPLHVQGPWEVSILYGHHNPSTKLLNKYGQSIHPLVLPYIQTNLFVYNNSSNIQRIFRFWNDMCLDENNHKLLEEEYFIWDESLMNVLLKRENCNVCIPTHLVNVYKLTDVQFVLEKYNPLSYISKLDPLGGYFPNKSEVSEDYMRIPLNRNDIKTFHGCKDINELEKIYKYLTVDNTPPSGKSIDKQAIIISSHSNNYYKEEITKSCISSLKNQKFDVILTSHYLEDKKDVIELADYYIYSENNPIIQLSEVQSSWYTNDFGVVYKTTETYGMGVLFNFLEGAKKAKKLGYKKAFFMNYDFIIHEHDFVNLQKIVDDTEKHHKLGYFYHVKMSNIDSLKTVFYYADVDMIIVGLSSIISNSAYIEKSKHTGILETVFGELFNDKNIIINYSDEKYDIFPNSIINIGSTLPRFVVFPIKDVDNSLALWFDIHNVYDMRFVINVYKNDKLLTYVLNQQNDIKFYKLFNYNETDEYKFELEIYDKNNTLKDEYYLELNYNLIKKLHTIGHFDLVNKSLLQYEEFSTNTFFDNIIVKLETDTNKIHFFSDSPIKTFTKISVKDLNSNVPMYYTQFTFPEGYTEFWVVPIPHTYIGRFIDIPEFNGLKIEFYDENDILIGSKTITTGKNTYTGLYLDNVNPFDCLYVNFYEFFIKKIYDNLIPDELDVVVDVGANNGIWTDYIKSRGAKKIYAIEPVKSSYQSMYNRFINDDNIILINKALYDSNGQQNLLIDSSNTTTSTLMSHYSKPDVKYLVDTMTFDRFVKTYNIKHIDLFKIDVEGAEYQIFESMSDTHFNMIDNMLIEFHNNYNNEVDKLIQKLELNGFKYLVRNQSTEYIGSLSADGGIIYAYKRTKNVKLIHLLTKPTDKRELDSINNLIQLKNYGIEYKQIVNTPYTELPPKENCLRPDDISYEPGYMKLSPGHYGCYKAHRDGILNNLDEDLDYLLVAECDAIIIKDIPEFIQLMNYAYEFCKQYSLPFFSFGPGDFVGQELINDKYISNRFIEAHLYLIPNTKFNLVKDIILNSKWDVADLWLNKYFGSYGIGFNKSYSALQAKGHSLIDKKYSEKNYLNIEKV